MIRGELHSAFLNLQIDGAGLTVLPETGDGMSADEFANQVYNLMSMLGYTADLDGNHVILHDYWDQYSSVSMEWYGGRIFGGRGGLAGL
jgi:hypothetical protein